MNPLDISAFPHLSKIGDGIFQSTDTIVKCSNSEISFLKQEAEKAIKKRSRICMHPNNEDLLHEMIIVLSSDTYIHPHRHLAKSESFHIVEGEVDVIIFTDTGEIEEVVVLGDYLSDKKFYYRLNNEKFHTLIIHTDYLVVHEVTNGPFSRELTELAKFAPDEDDLANISDYMESLKDRINKQNYT